MVDDGDRIDMEFSSCSDEEMKLRCVKSCEKLKEFENGGGAKWDRYMRATAVFLDCG